MTTPIRLREFAAASLVSIVVLILAIAPALTAGARGVPPAGGLHVAERPGIECSPYPRMLV
jgi:hypothetical protein